MKKVKILPHSMFYMKKDKADNTAKIMSQGEEGALLQDSYGVMVWVYYDEIAYLNNKPVLPVKKENPLIGRRVIIVGSDEHELGVAWHGTVGTIIEDKYGVCEGEYKDCLCVYTPNQGHTPFFVDELRYLNNHRVRV